MFILLGSFLLIVIWLLMVTLAVLCRKKQSQSEYNVSKDVANDDGEKDGLQEAGKYEAKDQTDDNHYKDEQFPEKDNWNDPNAPDVIQTVKLWYV